MYKYIHNIAIPPNLNQHIHMTVVDAMKIVAHKCNYNTHVNTHCVHIHTCTLFGPNTVLTTVNKYMYIHVGSDF